MTKTLKELYGTYIPVKTRFGMVFATITYPEPGYMFYGYYSLSKNYLCMIPINMQKLVYNSIPFDVQLGAYKSEDGEYNFDTLECQSLQIYPLNSYQYFTKEDVDKIYKELTEDIGNWIVLNPQFIKEYYRIAIQEEIDNENGTIHNYENKIIESVKKVEFLQKKISENYS